MMRKLLARITYSAGCLGIVLSLVLATPVGALSTGKIPVYRFYHLASGSHFYTTSETEKERVITTMPSKYRYEGFKFAGWLSDDGAERVPVARFYNQNTGTHFYTASSTETQRLKSTSGFRYEKIAYYGQSDYVDNDSGGNDYMGQCPLYRFYNFHNKTHFYTASSSEAYRVITDMGSKYRYEGEAYIIWYQYCDI